MTDLIGKTFFSSGTLNTITRPADVLEDHVVYWAIAEDDGKEWLWDVNHILEKLDELERTGTIDYAYSRVRKAAIPGCAKVPEAWAEWRDRAVLRARV